jgi:hypothetical protein
MARITAVFGFGVQVSRDFLTKVGSEVKTDRRCTLVLAGSCFDNDYRYYLSVVGDSIEEFAANKKQLQEFLDDWEHQLVATVPEWENRRTIALFTDIYFS